MGADVAAWIRESQSKDTSDEIIGKSADSKHHGQLHIGLHCSSISAALKHGMCRACTALEASSSFLKQITLHVEPADNLLR